MMENISSIPVLLIVPPLYSYDVPSIACCLLKACLFQKGIRCKVFHSNVLFAEMIGPEQFQAIYRYTGDASLRERLFLTSASDDIEWIFISKYYESEYVPDHLREFYDVFRGSYRNPITQTDFNRLEAQCKKLITETVRKVVPLEPEIIGFSCTMMQINASIALARALRKALPDTLFVIGGSNCSGVMGEEIAASTDVFDYVFQGEADDTFTDFCVRYLEDGFRPAEKLVHCVAPTNLDNLPEPDYTDYFEQFFLDPSQISFLAFEGSRGCWWGMKNPCRFCGLNSERHDFRQKSPDRVIEELESLQKKYSKTPSFFATDTICPKSYFKELFPRLAKRKFKGTIYYDVKSNLSYEQLASMKKAGVQKINPGIESLSTRLLQLMHKGTNAAGNIRLLRDCRELDIFPVWTFLNGIPGDKAEDYQAMCRFIPFLEHLVPPGFGPIIIQRFSPYFNDNQKYGVTNLQPTLDYEDAFPPTMDISRIALYFEAWFPSESRENPEVLVPLRDQINAWANRWRTDPPPVLALERGDDDFLIVRDSRSCAVEDHTVLSAEAYSLLKQCRSPIRVELLEKTAVLNRMLEKGFLIEVDRKLLSLVCEKPQRGDCK